MNLRRARANTYFELRDAEGAAPCCIWNSTLDRLKLPEGALRDGVEVVVGGGPDYYPGSASASPGFNFRCDHLRLAGEGDLLAQLDRSRRALAADGLLERQARPPRPALPRTIGVVTARSSAACADLLAGLERRGWRGTIVWADAPVQDRHAAPAIARALTRPGGDRAGRGRRRLPRRRQPLRPVGVLRRVAVPDGRAAAPAGGQRDRPRGRPDADRRRRRRLLLHPDPRRRGAGGGRRRRRPGRACARAARTRQRAGAARSPAAPSASPSARGRPTARCAPSARACTSCCARCAPRRRAAHGRAARLARTHALVIERKGDAFPAARAAALQAPRRDLRGARRPRPRAHPRPRLRAGAGRRRRAGDQRGASARARAGCHPLRRRCCERDDRGRRKRRARA